MTCDQPSNQKRHNNRVRLDVLRSGLPLCKPYAHDPSTQEPSQTDGSTSTHAAQHCRGYRKEGRNVGEASDDRECLSIFEDRARSEEEGTRLQTDSTYDMLPTGGDAKPSDDASNHGHNQNTCQMRTKCAPKSSAAVSKERRQYHESSGQDDARHDDQIGCRWASRTLSMRRRGFRPPNKLERNEPDSALRCAL